MKKKKLKNLSLTKSTVSHLNQKHIIGGARISIFICPIPFPLPQQTETGCSQLMECDSVAACTANVCKTIELDTETRPIC
ncbi:hypothetical protein KORDIASMS9_03052 [Kordia sp. SMS9]|uniref:hypothetical protein n=1 Tax=Kordia sp. SMS9 TaxID=2282170 RepID=UPI000E10B841|nr:hypothetical protein [Kordia sp. SMS9]AXG70806.1 hypothetical protein KORDIASMS9_03052 [Kordia sp. SMS9]